MSRTLPIVLAALLLCSGAIAATTAPVLAGTPTSGPLSLTVDAVTVEASEEVTLSMTLENVGDETTYAPAVDVDAVPEGWTVTDADADSGTWKSSSKEFTWLTPLEPGEQVTPSVTFALPTGATTTDLPVEASDGNGNEVETTATVTVEGAGVDVDGDGKPSTDVDDDGYHEDVDGDGDFDVFDVEAFFVDVTGDEDAVGHDVFNFDGEGGVDIFDVLELFRQL